MSVENTVVGAFSAEDVVRLTGLTMRQLGHWDRTGFFAPEYADADRRTPFSRIYSFKDVVGLRSLSVLKGKHGVSLPHLRDVAAALAGYTKTPWADLKLKVWNRKVSFDDPETGNTREVLSGQYVLFPLVDVIDEVRQRVADLRVRQDVQVGRVERHRYVAHNAPVLAGTRIPVEAVRRFLKAGYSPEQIVAEYPLLRKEDVILVAGLPASSAA